MKRRYKFIAIEGIDGVGKSTVVKHLSEQYGYCAVVTPPTWLNRVRQAIDISKSIALRFAFYLFSDLVVSLQILYLVQRNNVVCDRYIASTIAYHPGIWVVFAKISCWLILTPNITIHLTAGEEVRRTRLNQQALTHTRHRVSQWDDPDSVFLTRAKQLLMRRCDVEIDTSYESVEKIALRIHSLINSLLRG